MTATAKAGERVDRATLMRREGSNEVANFSKEGGPGRSDGLMRDEDGGLVEVDAETARVWEHLEATGKHNIHEARMHCDWPDRPDCPDWPDWPDWPDGH